jgi:hypothetical protein
MHAYATNTKDRENIPKYLTVGAVAVALLFNTFVQNFKLPIPWYIDTPAVASFYGLFLLLFDKYLWRWKLGPIRLSTIPDIRGTWVGKIHSSYNNIEVQVVVYIQQTWSKLSIKLDTQNSTSFTIMASLNVNADNDSSLRYEYQNEGKAYGPTPDHRGTGHLHLPFDHKLLEGKYYTSEGSNNTGTLVLHFISREYLDRQEALKLARQRNYI